ncbi:mandelate racemase/muconate lactonizing enzyme family protein [Paracidobacterium acidisoli]|uniref:Mandelate racemase/muconate lactonizing enzyme family protein n=1 Tax=Paracidobacterium acidisoli TaxID=2303751 RepID=A0A372ILP4_9BACT|nr:mandelate racemase/muconate lactonizing enzyme family protein [Paracidobacterium acidisoli]MBT9332400.1 mandelate racemase/muconate lactonizing enzyme family protein [Paracidobacterium acidisoli]
MPSSDDFVFNRRGILKGSAAMLAGAMLSGTAEASSAPFIQNVNANSGPSKLKITDLRYAVVEKPGPSPCVIIRMDTNQGVYGLGEVRDVAGPNYAMVLKSRLLGENPLNISYLFQKIQQFGGGARQAGGVCAVEMALWDIAGKVYNVPVYQMLGGKWRDKVRVYADTTESMDPKEYGQRAKERAQGMGLTWIKMDLGINVLEGIPNAVTQPAGLSRWERNSLPHPFVATEVTDKGIDRLCEYVAAVRDAIGMEIPLSMDHLGHIGVNSVIRLGKAYEKFNLAWMEDVIPWYYTDMLKHITDSMPTPTITGEDIYNIEDFEKLCANHAVSKIHPDLATSGGIKQTHLIGDMAFKYGVPMAMHFAGTPVSCMANVHCAAATQNFLALENHSLDVPWWQDLVEGIEKSIINKGFITVPEGPGLGVTLNEDVVRKHLRAGTGYFEPTTQWDSVQSWDDALFS